jgi:glutathione S-transferase
LGDRPYFAGDNITHPDFHMYEMLCVHNKLAPGILEKYPKLVAFMKRFEALPTLSAYLKSDK